MYLSDSLFLFLSQVYSSPKAAVVGGVLPLPDLSPLAVDPADVIDDNEVTPDKQVIPVQKQPPGAPVRMCKGTLHAKLYLVGRLAYNL